MLAEWRCTAYDAEEDDLHCPCRSPQMEMVDGRFLCPRHAREYIETNPGAVDYTCLVAMPPSIPTG